MKDSATLSGRRDDSKSSIMVDEHSPGYLPQLKVPKRTISFQDSEVHPVEEHKEGFQENTIPSLEGVSPRQDHNQFGSPPLSTILSLSSQEESPGLQGKIRPKSKNLFWLKFPHCIITFASISGFLKTQKPIKEEESPSSSREVLKI